MVLVRFVSALSGSNVHILTRDSEAEISGQGVTETWYTDDAWAR